MYWALLNGYPAMVVPVRAGSARPALGTAAAGSARQSANAAAAPARASGFANRFSSFRSITFRLFYLSLAVRVTSTGTGLEGAERSEGGPALATKESQ